MIFQSFEFAAFLAAAVSAYFVVPNKLRVWVLLAANAVFFLSADLAAGIWLALSVLSTWGTALLMERAEKRRGRGLLLAACSLVNLSLLAVFKYFPVWEDMVNAGKGQGLRLVKLDIAETFGWAVPLGISFYTLQAVGYLVDVYQKKYAPQKNLAKYAVFAAFFPNISSGPIERGDHFGKQLDALLHKRRRELWNYDRMMQGLIAILLGFFMKMVIADRAALLVDYLYSVYTDGSSFTMLMAAVFYSIQIYCDFASYSCIAVGVGRLFGFELIQNFRQPYFAEGIGDFWRRWHISLSSWLRDYVYIPLGGNRKGKLRRYGNLLIVFFVSGLWHGGAPVFIVWGLLHGVFQILEDCWKNLCRAIWGERKLPFKRVRRLCSRMLTFFAVTCLWIFFRSESLEMAKVCLTNLFTRPAGFLYAKDFLYVMGLEKVEFWIAVCAVLFLFGLDLISEKTKKETAVWIYASPLPVRWLICLILLLSTAVVGMYGSGYDASSFIYIRF